MILEYLTQKPAPIPDKIVSVKHRLCSSDTDSPWVHCTKAERAALLRQKIVDLVNTQGAVTVRDIVDVTHVDRSHAADVCKSLANEGKLKIKKTPVITNEVKEKKNPRRLILSVLNNRYQLTVDIAKAAGISRSYTYVMLRRMEADGTVSCRGAVARKRYCRNHELSWRLK